MRTERFQWGKVAEDVPAYRVLKSTSRRWMLSLKPRQPSLMTWKLMTCHVNVEQLFNVFYFFHDVQFWKLLSTFSQQAGYFKGWEDSLYRAELLLNLSKRKAGTKRVTYCVCGRQSISSLGMRFLWFRVFRPVSEFREHCSMVLDLLYYLYVFFSFLAWWSFNSPS